MTVKITLLWDITPCSFFYTEDVGSTLLLSVGKHLQDYTVLHTKIIFDVCYRLYEGSVPGPR
jgi:hypothetical protein